MTVLHRPLADGSALSGIGWDCRPAGSIADFGSVPNTPKVRLLRHDPQSADFLVGLILFVVLTVRTLKVHEDSQIEGNTFRRRVACAVALLVCAVASIAGQFYLGEPIRPLTLLPLVGIGLGCLGKSSNNMIVRRRCVLAMGCVMAAFGLATEAWGLVFKNLVSDVGATIYSINKYGDPPLPTIAVWYQGRLTD